ncbi:hypothetical protein LINGRAHAP2_LOCUS21159 [Linum grandiflorum]
MNCLAQFQSPFLPLPLPSSFLKHNNQPWRSATQTLLPPQQPRKLCGRKLRNTTRTQAMLNSYIDSLVLGVATTRRGGDISVLLQTGGVMLFFYVLSNFVVPSFLMKYYESEAADEDDDDVFPDKD